MSEHHPIADLGLGAMSPDELASVSEIAAMLGVPKRTAARYVDRADFPAPVDTLAVGRVWRRRDVERWAAKTLRLKRGPQPKARKRRAR